MLDFEHGTQFQLVLRIAAFGSGSIYVTGATKAGVFTFKHALTGAYAKQTATFNIGDVPIWVTVQDSDSVLTQGYGYAVLDLALNGDKVYQLCGGHIYQRKGISWPNTDISAPAPLTGAVLATTEADPAAGANKTIAMPTGFVNRIKAVSFVVVTSATVANREAGISFDIGGTPAINVTAGTTQTASQTKQYVFTTLGGTVNGSLASNYAIPIPADILLDVNSDILAYLSNKQVGDQITAIYWTAEQFVAI